MKKESSDKKEKRDDAWKIIKPKPGEACTKQVKSKLYHWCMNHKEEGMWVIHCPEDCRNKQKKKLRPTRQNSQCKRDSHQVTKMKRNDSYARLVNTFHGSGHWRIGYDGCHRVYGSFLVTLDSSWRQAYWFPN